MAYDVSLLLAFNATSLWAVANGVSLGLLPRGIELNEALVTIAERHRSFLFFVHPSAELQYMCAQICIVWCYKCSSLNWTICTSVSS